VLRLAQQKEREGAGRHTWRMRSSPAKGSAKTGQMAPPIAQSPPTGKEEKGGESPREGRGRGRDELEALSGRAVSLSMRVFFFLYILPTAVLI